jgi:glycosyltransferase involved in cell wall biosynthesis
MKKILLTASLASSLRNFRGPLIDALRNAGHQVHVAAPEILRDTETCGWLAERGVICHDVPLSRAGLNPVADLRAMLVLRRLMRRLKPDVFMGYTAKPVIWGLIAARLARVPVRVALITGLGYAFTDGAGGVRGMMRWIVGGLYRTALRCATLIFFQNPDDHADFQRMGLIPSGVPVRLVAGSGIHLDHFPKQPLPPGPIRFLLIARLLADKGIREYVGAARLLRKEWPMAEFHLVGGTDPNPAGIAEAVVKAWHADGDVIWHGKVSDVRRLLAQAHVYVLPSYREGTPRTVLEAMATGRAVITTDAPGCRQTVAEGETGFLVPVRDERALAAAMLRFLQEPALIERFGTAGRDRAKTIFDVNQVNALMLQAMGLDAARGSGFSSNYDSPTESGT